MSWTKLQNVVNDAWENRDGISPAIGLKLSACASFRRSRGTLSSSAFV